MGSSLPVLENDPAIDAQPEVFLDSGWQNTGTESYSQPPIIGDQPNDFLGSTLQTLSNDPRSQQANLSLTDFENMYHDQYTYLESEFSSSLANAFGD